MATSNFLQFDPYKRNLSGDTAWENSEFRKYGGAQNGILESYSFNKLAYQTSTMVAALAQMMATKGYEMNDSTISTLTTNLANIMTVADMTPYATTTQLDLRVPKGEVILVSAASYTVPVTAYFRVVQLSGVSVPSAFTLPSPSGSGMSGVWIKFKNACTDSGGKIAFGGTIDGESVTLEQNEEIVVYSDGTVWRGKKIPGSIDLVVGAPNTTLFTDKNGSVTEWSKSFGVELFTRDARAASGDIDYTGSNFKPNAIIMLGANERVILGSRYMCIMSVGVSDFVNSFSIGLTAQQSGSNVDKLLTTYSIADCFYCGASTGLETPCGQSASVKTVNDDGVTLTWSRIADPGSGTSTIGGAIIYIR